MRIGNHNSNRGCRPGLRTVGRFDLVPCGDPCVGRLEERLDGHIPGWHCELVIADGRGRRYRVVVKRVPRVRRGSQGNGCSLYRTCLAGCQRSVSVILASNGIKLIEKSLYCYGSRWHRELIA